MKRKRSSTRVNNNTLVNCNALGNRDHPWLQFADFEAKYTKRLESLWPRRHLILASRRLDLAALDTVGQGARWSRMMTNPWHRLFRVHEVQYVELLMEFFSTFEFDYPCQNLKDKKTVKFRMGGKWKQISVERFAELLGIYTPEEIRASSFTEGITEFPSEHVKNQFWFDQGVGVYDPSCTTATSLRDPLLRIVHRCLVYSISGRGHGDTVVNLRELFYLYCLVQPHTCNLAHTIAWYFLTSSGRDVSSAVCGGHLVTLIAKSSGLLTDKVLGSLTAVGETKVMTIATLKHMQIVTKTSVGLRLIDRWKRVWDPDRPEPDPDRVQAIEGPGTRPESPHQWGELVKLPTTAREQFAFLIAEQRRYWAWDYECRTIHAAATGTQVQYPRPYFMQPPPQPPHQPLVDHVQQPQVGDLGGTNLDVR